MSIKKYITVLALLFPVLLAAQNQFDDYSFDQLTTTAEYGEGERQSNAQNALAIRYNTGTKGAPLNPSKAVYWFKRSADNGNKYAMNNLAYAYLEGKGTDTDISKAVYWMEESARLYFPGAALTVGKWYYHGTYVTQDYNNAVRYFKDAAFGDKEEAMYYYAWCFAYGQGVVANYDKAFFWANRALDKNYSPAYLVLGNMYRYGKTVEINANRAKRYYEKGAEQGNWSCMIELGVGYLSDFFGERNIEKAAEYFTNAANQGSADAMGRLGDLNFYKEYGIDDLSTAAYWYQKAYDSGYGEKHYKRLVLIYRYLENYGAAIRLYMSKVEAGDTDAMNKVAYLYADGKGVAQNYDTAISYIDKAISLAPNEPNYLDSKGEILLKKGDVKGATKVWKKLNSTFPLYYQNYMKENDGETTPLDEYMKATAK